MNKHERRCLECNHKLSGRSDKKFCCDQCRATFNNRSTSDKDVPVRLVNNILRRNRRILSSLNPNGKAKISRRQLLQQGFDLDHFTSIYTTRAGAIYKYCYDQGYLAVDDEHFLLVIKKTR